MKETSTIENIDVNNMEIAKGHFLRELLLKLPDEKVRHILKSPRKEVVERLKWKIHNSLLEEES